MQQNPIYDTEVRGVMNSPFARGSFCPPDGPRSEDGEEEEAISVDSTFYRPHSVMLYYSKTPFRFAGRPDDEGISYTLPPGIDCLQSSYLRMLTPELKIRKKYAGEYRMCFTSYLGYSIIKDAYVTVGNVRSRLTPYSCVCYVQHNSGRSQKSLARRAGVHPSLTKWTTLLSPYELTPYQPWWYGDRPWSSLQVHELNRQCRLTHDYTFNLNIASHMRMQRFVAGNWVNVKFDKKVVKGMPVDGNFPSPELHGSASTITPGEKSIRAPDEPVYIDTIMSFGGDNDHTYKDTPDFQIDAGSMLLKTIYISARNNSSLEHNEHFDMTACKGVLTTTPISTVDLNYGTTAKKFSLSSEQLEGAARDKDFDSTPLHRGYLAYTNSCEASRPGLNMGIVSGDMKMNAKIALKQKERGFVDTRYSLFLDCVVTMICDIEEGVLKTRK